MAATHAAPVEPFSISVVPDRERVAVIPVGELDLSCADQLEGEVRTLREVGFEHVVVDLRQVRYLDSSGLRVLLALRGDAERDGHRLTLLPGPRPVQRIFELTATDALFTWGAA